MAGTNADAISFCKIDAHLDSNPKIRKAGRDGRDVFEFIVRRNSLMERDGSIPLRYIDPAYLADMLMMSEDEACHGVSRAVTACLIELDESNGVVRIVGWTPDWGRTRRSDAERKADQRAREKAAADSKPSKLQEPVTRNRDTCDMSREVTTVTDQRRGEEIREEGEERVAIAPLHPPLLLEAPNLVTRRAPRFKRPETSIPADWEPSDAHKAECRATGVDCTYEAVQFKTTAIAKAKTYVDWDAAFRTWIGKSAKWAAERGSRPGGHTPAGERPRQIPVAKPRISEDT